MHEENVAVAVLRVLDRLAGADGDHAHLDAGLLGEERQHVVEQPGVLRRGGRLHDDELVLGGCGGGRAGEGEPGGGGCRQRSEETTSERKSIMRISSTVFCLKTKIN